MRRDTILIALAVLTLALVPGAVTAKKPQPPPEPDPDPEIAFTRQIKVGRSYVSQLVVMNADGSNLTVVTEGVYGGCGWSPDGTRLTFYAPNPDSGLGLYVVDLDGDNRTKLTDVDSPRGNPVWSPATEGSTVDLIAYIDREGSPGTVEDVYVIKANGTDRRQLTDTTYRVEKFPTWSPSGTRLACAVIEEDEHVPTLWGLYDFESDPGYEYSVQPIAGLPTDVEIGHPSWSKTDENEIAWAVSVSGGYDDIWIADPDEIDNPYALTQTSGTDEDYPNWSSDDSKIVFMSRKKKGKTLGTPRIEVLIVSDPTDREVIIEQTGMPVWVR